MWQSFSPTKKIWIIITAFLLFISIAVGITLLVKPSISEQETITKNATNAAKVKNPNAVASDVKVADNYAMATVSDPTANTQAESGNTTIFKVNEDGSMEQIAEASYFSPIDLLGLGLSLTTQSKLANTTTEKIKQSLVDTCNYPGDAPGYLGFESTFNPDWQIDPATLRNLTDKLSSKIMEENAKADDGQAIVCINALRDDSDSSIDDQTYVSTFIFYAQFITEDGIISKHKLTFSVGPNYYRSYALDGLEL